MYNFIVSDVETGGYFAHENAVAEIGAITLNGETLKEIGRFDSIIAPYNKELTYTKEALNANGLTMDMINKGAPIKQVVQKFIDLAIPLINGKGKFQRKPIIVGHNMHYFDRPFLEAIFKHCGKNLYDYVDTWMYDTMVICRHKWGFREKGFKLGECCARVGIQIIDAHRAMADIEGNAELFRYLMKNPSIQDNSPISITSQAAPIKKFRHGFQF